MFLGGGTNAVCILWEPPKRRNNENRCGRTSGGFIDILLSTVRPTLHASLCLLVSPRVWAIAFLLSVGGLGPALGQEADPTQDEVLFRNVQSSGGYGAPTLAVTTVNGEMALTSRGKAAGSSTDTS